MILLGIDTCGATGSLALARVVDGAIEVLGHAEAAARRTAAELTPALRQMLAAARVKAADIGGIVVVDGPGSFTGIRVGLSTAKGLAEGWGVPIFAVSRLRVLAGTGGKLPVLDAGRGDFYVGQYGDGAGEWLLTREELDKHVEQSSAGMVVCEERMAAVLEGARVVAAPGAVEAIRVALPKVLGGESSDVTALDGRYLRRSELYKTVAPVA